MFILVFYYVIAVALIIPPIYLVALGFARPVRATVNFFGAHWDFDNTFVPREHPGWWDPAIFMWVALCTLAVIVCGAVYMLHAMSRGGGALARMLGGTETDPDSKNPCERRLLNIVEEMAIASGVPVPDVFLVHTSGSGINAFTAGLTPNDAAIGVTRACMEMLSREELQGVIAHEFSHILYGDMRLKTIMLCMLHGIAYPGSASSRLCLDACTGESAHAVLVIGVFLVFWPVLIPFLLVSQIGVWFAEIIKGAVSKQQEFVADAAAVQFTRNPDGVLNALKKVGGYAAGTRVLSIIGKEMSHFFFADAMGHCLVTGSLFSAHPPLAKRVRRFEPDFKGEFPYVPSLRKMEMERMAAEAETRKTPEPALAVPDHVKDLVDAIGSPRPEHLVYAGTLLGSMPRPIKEAVHAGNKAGAVVYALLLDPDEAVRKRQLDYLEAHLDPVVHREVLVLSEEICAMASERRLPVVELAVHALKSLSRAGYLAFMRHVEALVQANARVDLFERALQGMIQRHLSPRFVPSRALGRLVVQNRMPPLLPACGKLLSCLARWGSHEEGQREAAFRKGAAELEGGGGLAFQPTEDAAVDELNNALDALATASPDLKKQVVSACIACVTADGRISVAESEMLQIVSDALECPMPPLVACG